MDLLGTVLGAVARDSGSASVLTPVWRQAAGETVSQAASPVRWEGRRLVFRCTTSAWARELTRQAPELLGRLQLRLGKKTVDALVFESP